MPRLFDVAVRLGGWPRRVAALCCLLLAAGTALAARSSPARSDAGPTRPVVVASHELAAGKVLAAADLTVTQWPTGLAPPGALPRVADAVGHRLGGGLGAREPVTRARLVGASLTTGLPAGTAATTVTLASAGAAGLVQPGDFVDLFASAAEPDAASTAQVVAERVLVLAVLKGSGAEDPPELAVAVDRATALRLATLGGRSFLALVRNPP